MKKILVVDDQKDILEVFKILFESKGYEVKTLNDGEKVIETTLAFLPDVIILDVFLAGTDGIDICNQLKTIKAIENIPVIMISAHTNAETILKDCPADAFVAKPFDISHLAAVIELQLNKAAG